MEKFGGRRTSNEVKMLSTVKTVDYAPNVDDADSDRYRDVSRASRSVTAKTSSSARHSVRRLSQQSHESLPLLQQTIQCSVPQSFDAVTARSRPSIVRFVKYSRTDDCDDEIRSNDSHRDHTWIHNDPPQWDSSSLYLNTQQLWKVSNLIVQDIIGYIHVYRYATPHCTCWTCVSLLFLQKTVAYRGGGRRSHEGAAKWGDTVKQLQLISA